MKVVGVLTADPPDSQPGDRCRTRSKGIYRSNFPRTPFVELFADTDGCYCETVFDEKKQVYLRDVQKKRLCKLAYCENLLQSDM